MNAADEAARRRRAAEADMEEQRRAAMPFREDDGSGEAGPSWRQSRGQTRDEALYGVFGEGSDDDDRRRRRGRHRQRSSSDDDDDEGTAGLGGGGRFDDSDSDAQDEASLGFGGGRRRRRGGFRGGGDSSDNDGDEGGRRRRSGPSSRKRARRDADSRPVAFVSGGKTGGEEAEDEGEEKEEPTAAAAAARPASASGGGARRRSDDGEDDDDNGGRPGPGAPRGGLGLGAGEDADGWGGVQMPARGGLGFAPAAAAAGDDGQPEKAAEGAVLPTAFGQRVLKAAAEKKRRRQEEKQQQQQQQRGGGGGAGGAGGSGAAGAGASAAGAAAPAPRPPKDFATFERHTKGIGLKLLSKMGFQPGKGLGKEGKGRAKPLEAVLRPKGAGLGLGGERGSGVGGEDDDGDDGEEAAAKERRARRAAEADEESLRRELDAAVRKLGGSAAGAAAIGKQKEQQQRVPQARPLWRRRDGAARAERALRSAEDVLREEQERARRESGQVPASNKAAASALRGGGGGGGGMVVVDMRGPQSRVHNLSLVVDLAEAALRRLDARLAREAEALPAVTRRKEQLRAEAEQRAASAARLAAAASAAARACSRAERWQKEQQTRQQQGQKQGQKQPQAAAAAAAGERDKQQQQGDDDEDELESLLEQMRADFCAAREAAPLEYSAHGAARCAAGALVVPLLASAKGWAPQALVLQDQKEEQQQQGQARLDAALRARLRRWRPLLEGERAAAAARRRLQGGGGAGKQQQPGGVLFVDNDDAMDEDGNGGHGAPDANPLASWRARPGGHHRDGGGSDDGDGDGDGDGNQQHNTTDPDPDTADPYLLVVWEVALPGLRAACQAWAQRSRAREPDRLLSLLARWLPLLPPRAARCLLLGLVLPALRRAVDAYDPLIDPQPPHVWLHPWLPALGADAMAPLWPTLRQRFSSALGSAAATAGAAGGGGVGGGAGGGGWHPSDASAVVVLRPWRRVFDPRDWDALLRRAVLPKLEAALRSGDCGLSLRPDAPRTAPLRWAAAWGGAAPDDALAALFERAVWPQAHAVLRHWLSALPPEDGGASDPKQQQARARGLAEAAAWLSRVAALAPAEVRAHQRGRAALGALLRLLGAAADGAPLPDDDGIGSRGGAGGGPPAPSSRAPDGGASRWDDEEGEEEEEEDDPLAAAARRAAGGGGGGGGASAAAAASLRELVARFAADAGLDFAPRPGRSHMGLPVYSFGGVSVVLQPHAGSTAGAVAGGGGLGAGGGGGGGGGGGTLLARRADGRWAAASLQELVEMASSGRR